MRNCKTLLAHNDKDQWLIIETGPDAFELWDCPLRLLARVDGLDALVAVMRLMRTGSTEFTVERCNDVRL